ncbi:MAG: hypothetical protein WCJ37_10275, partial [Syntrophus sp. (in: bacteria)]
MLSSGEVSRRAVLRRRLTFFRGLDAQGLEDTGCRPPDVLEGPRQIVTVVFAPAFGLQLCQLAVEGDRLV